MEETDVLIVGDDDAGMVAATSGKAFYPDKDFLLLRDEKGCAILRSPSGTISAPEDSDRDTSRDRMLAQAGIRVITGKPVALDTSARSCLTTSEMEIRFQKLVLALGAIPRIPSGITGTGLRNVFTVEKGREYLEALSSALSQSQRVTILGGGFIGVEIANELSDQGKEVTLVDILPHILELAFDEELSVIAEGLLRSKGVHVRTLNGIREIRGEKEVRTVLLESGEELEADAVILATGLRPDTALAEKAGLELNSMGFIQVDEYMRTENTNIFAIGDCAEKRGFLLRKPLNSMLSSAACAEARIAAINLFRLSVVKTFGGTIGICSVRIGDTCFGIAGITENLALQHKFNIIAGSFEGTDMHPETLPGAHRQLVKLITARESGVIIGGQIMGGQSTGELINLIGIVIQNHMSVNSILTAQIGTHPLFTAGPLAYPLVKAAESIALSRWAY